MKDVFQGYGFPLGSITCVRGVVAKRLVRWTPDRKVRVRALAGQFVLCSWARHFTLTVPLSTQEYKCVTCDGLATHPGGVPIFLVASCYGNKDKLRWCGPLGSSCADFYQ